MRNQIFAVLQEKLKSPSHMFFYRLQHVFLNGRFQMNFRKSRSAELGGRNTPIFRVFNTVNAISANNLEKQMKNGNRD